MQTPQLWVPKAGHSEQFGQAGSMAWAAEPAALLAGPPVLSEPQINTAGDRGNRACKQPFGQESKPTAWLHHHFLWAVIPPSVAGWFCPSLSLYSSGNPEPRNDARPNGGPWG